MATISIATDFSRFPGPRYRNDGPFSGQQFREDMLSPALKKAVSDKNVLTVVLDDVAGYGSSFLEESFGGLVREGYSRADLADHFRLVASTDRFQHHLLRAEEYIAEQFDRSKAAG